LLGASRFWLAVDPLRRQRRFLALWLRGQGDVGQGYAASGGRGSPARENFRARRPGLR